MSKVTPETSGQIAVWDVCVRACHWALVAAIALAWLSTLGLGLVSWHEPAGYGVLVIVVVRIGWGFWGGHFARFTQFVYSSRVVLNYLVQVRWQREARFIGHNPAGGWMVLALLGCAAATAATGWLFNTDLFWGTAWLMLLHTVLAWMLLFLIALHVVGVVFTSYRHRENLVKAMVTGKKANAQMGDVL